MVHVEPGNGLPGNLRSSDPSAPTPASRPAGVLPHAPSSLGRGERELIAAYVSELTGTEFCPASHSAFAAARLTGGRDVVEAVPTDPAAALQIVAQGHLPRASPA
ncbi:hypothetical protein [Streptomyces sp. NPDC096152]|uniref:hypothetical protein n=1 Tax=Streptomyces sp. NPDC096152 TaxID=3366078 RepID=UPI00381D49DB